MLDPDESVALGEDGNVDRFGDSFVLIGSHPLEKGGQADKGFRHLGEVLSRQGGHGHHEGPVIAFRLRRPERQPRGLSQARPNAARANVSAGGGLDIGRSRLDPREQETRWSWRIQRFGPENV